MAHIIGIAGSLRRASFNAALLRAAMEVAPPELTVEIVSIADIPLYNGDVEDRGFPESVKSLKDKVTHADGLLIATPEYNHSLPGVLKNTIDWLSRPSAEIGKVFGGKPLALMGASLGPGGSGLAQAAWMPVLQVLKVKPWVGAQLIVPAAAKAFDADGKLIDEKIKASLKTFIAGFSEFIQNK